MLRFVDSFSHYSTSQIGMKYTNAAAGLNGGPTISSSGGRDGRGAGIFLFGESISQTLDNQQVWVVGFAIKVTQLSSNTIGLVALKDSSSNQVRLNLNGDSTLAIERNGTVLGTSTATLMTNVWSYVEFKAYIGNSIPANSCAIRLNSITILTLAATTDTQDTANAYANVVQFGSISGSLSQTNLDMCDLYICDGQGSANKDFLGDLTVEALFPNGVGFYNQLTPTGAALDYNAVNEVVIDSDTTYVSANTTNLKDSYAFTNPSFSISTVFGIQFVTTAKKVGSGSRSIVPLVRVSSTDYESAATSLGTSYSASTKIVETNPNTAVAWVETDVTNLEAGIRLG